MIGIDTNVLIRMIARDDPKQLRQAVAVMQTLTPKQPGWVGISCLLEVVWVLTSRLRVSRDGIANVLDDLLSIDSIVVEQSEVVAGALTQFRRGKAEFADCLIAASAHAAGCKRIVTFDEMAARDAGMDLITS